jgi:hypothetical protein
VTELQDRSQPRNALRGLPPADEGPEYGKGAGNGMVTHVTIRKFSGADSMRWVIEIW